MRKETEVKFRKRTFELKETNVRHQEFCCKGGIVMFQCLLFFTYFIFFIREADSVHKSRNNG